MQRFMGSMSLIRDGWKPCDILLSALPLALSHKVFFIDYTYLTCLICFSSPFLYINLNIPKVLPLHLVGGTKYLFSPTRGFRGFCVCHNYSFYKRFPKFVWNYRSSLRTWQFHYVLVNQIVNLEMKLWISCHILLGS